LFSGDIVNVSAGDNTDKEGSTYSNYFPNCENFFTTNYNPGSFRGYEGREKEFLVDLERELNPDLLGRFEIVFNHTTLEHIYHVHKAFENLAKMTKDVLIVVVPFAQVEHYSDGFCDHWRLTPQGVRRLMKENGLSVIYESESPQKNAAIYLFFVGSRNPSKWHDKLPKFKPIGVAGNWIGRRSNILTRSINWIKKGSFE
jgi:hypothetical protein